MRVLPSVVPSLRHESLRRGDGPPVGPVGVLLVVACLGAAGWACAPRPDRPDFLCCMQECTAGLVKARKDTPRRVDAGWACGAGVPIGYNEPCSFDEGTECVDDTQQGSSSGGAPSDGGALDGAPADQ